MSKPLGSRLPWRPPAPTVLVVGATDTFVRRCRNAVGARAAVVGIPCEAVRSAASLIPRVVVLSLEVYAADRERIDALIASSRATLVRVADEEISDESLKQQILGGVAPSGTRRRTQQESVVLAVGCPTELVDRCRDVVGTFGHVLRECDARGLKDSAEQLRPVLIVVVDELYQRDPVEVAAVAVDSCAELAVLGEELRPLELAWLLVSTMKNAERPF